jgi:arginyl-tRNA synthetase
MLTDELASCLQQAATEVLREGSIPSDTPLETVIEHPQNPEHGDFASSLPLRLARLMGMPPLPIAKKIAEHISLPPQVAKVEIAPPGFINFTLRPDWLARQVDCILSSGESYGDLCLGRGTRIQLEFVSANPTGPLHVGHGRGAVLGSTLANVLSAAGYHTETEYYLNDTGNQIAAFGRSLYARYQQCLGREVHMPSDGYLGDYLIGLAKEIVQQHGDRFLSWKPEDAISELSKIGTEKMTDGIRGDLNLMDVRFDRWFSEKHLYESGQYDKAMRLLEDKGYVVTRDNATWFESSALGEDKDNVLVRSDGSPTYFASDIAYHYNKFVERGFDQVIDIWGADHQGHVPRMRTVLEALGGDPRQFKVIICQLVTLRRGKETVKVSKRSGGMVTLRELLDEVGSDACRFVFLSRSADSQMDFDIDLAKRQSADNPVYYVQYAHARIASILRLAQQRGIDWSEGDVSQLRSEPELTLIRQLILLPEVIEEVANTLQPHHLPYYAQDVATVFHRFYKRCRVISQNSDLSQARLKLVAATQFVLARVLHLMGIAAPERM